jgi:hypothetical protein
MAIAATGEPIGIGSEGTIGPDPVLGLTMRDLEIVALVDEELGIVVHGVAVGFAIASSSVGVRRGDDLDSMLEVIGFPEQRLIVRSGVPGDGPIVKGIGDRLALERAVDLIATSSAEGIAIVEPDFRAQYCPSRRPTIAEAAADLANRLVRCCERCGAPGFASREVIAGLPCAACSLPTSLERAVMEACVRCDEHREVVTASGMADPAFCHRCNP